MDDALRLLIMASLVVVPILIGIGILRRGQTKSRPLTDPHPSTPRPESVALPLVQNAVHDMAKLIEGLQFRLAEMEHLPDEAENQWRKLFEEVNEDVKGIADYTLDLKLLWQLNGSGPTLRREAVDLRTLSDEVLAHLAPTARHANVRLSCQSQAELLRIYVDRHQMKRVLINLVDNAIRYSTNQPEAYVRVTLLTEAGHMVIEVADNGVGIPAEHLQKFWEESFKPRDMRTIDIAGSGLGTVIVRQVVEQHGGKVEVTSSPGLTKFNVVLPLSAPLSPLRRQK